MGTWAAYIAMLSAELSPAEKHALRDELMSRARHVASRAVDSPLALAEKCRVERLSR